MDEIVQAAWELSRENGLGNFSMRDLGARVGMRAQSVYSYFASKLEIIDAMFLDGNRAFMDSMTAALAEGAGDDDLADLLGRTTRGFFEFCTSDPVRFQLLFQRTIPDFVPSDESYAVAQEAYDIGFAPLAAHGAGGESLDLVTAVMAGLVAQQLANDPGGDRWARLSERATAMLASELALDLAAGGKPRETK